MALTIIQNDRGRRRVNPVGAVSLICLGVITCMALPAGVFWWIFGDLGLVRTTLIVGMVISGSFFGAVLAAGLRTPLGSLPSKRPTEIGL